MRFKIGELWKSRDGQKIKILKIHNPDQFYIEGIDEAGNKVTYIRTGENYDGPPSPGELIEPWKDPEPKMKAWLVKEDGKSGYTLLFFKSGDALYEGPPIEYKRAEWLDEK